MAVVLKSSLIIRFQIENPCGEAIKPPNVNNSLLSNLP